MVSHLQRQDHSFSSALLAAVLVIVMALSLPEQSAAKLSLDYYQKTCPQASKIMTQVVTNKQIANPTTAAGTLRLFFHDCFVGGCDVVVVVTNNTFNRTEHDADLNLCLPGDSFDVVVHAKNQLKIECLGIGSCSDILALATRDLVTMLDEPFYPVLGRKDALVSKGNLPRPNMTLFHTVSIFTAKGSPPRNLPD